MLKDCFLNKNHREVRRKIFIVVAIFIFIVLSYQIFFTGNKTSFSCNKGWGVIYLLPSEKNLAQGIADRGNLAVIISDKEGESNSIIGSTELLNCPNFYYEDYL